MSEISIMKEVISLIDHRGYSRKILYRFRDIRSWGEKTLVSISYVPLKCNSSTKVQSTVLKIDPTQFKKSLDSEINQMFQRIDAMIYS